ncbi:MAG: gfo/Idh/MocA family oxidoreductase, partial [Nitrospinae bacterium]|nr:gfo/Idh/MocA family oxidoreductase [Nitrospinota bacterium]
MLTPMVISGTHALDVMLFVMGPEKQPVEVVSRSISRVMTGIGTQDATFSIFTFDDGTIWSMECNWGMPTIWPASTYGVTISVVGTEGALTIDDTHADFIMAS